MKELNVYQTQAVAGGVNCLDAATWDKINQKAIKDGLTLAVIGVPLLSAVTFGVSQSFAVTTMIAVVAAPYVAGFGYFKSSAWNLFS